MRSIAIGAALAAAMWLNAASAEPGDMPAAPAAPASKATGGTNFGTGNMYVSLSSGGLMSETESKGVLPCSHTGNSCRESTGIYRIKFTRNIRNCGFSAAAGSNAARSFAIDVFDDITLRVGVWNTAGQVFADQDFRLIVLC